MLTLGNVGKTYHKGKGTVDALSGVSLEVARGELVAVRGPSGSGKTTLLLAAGALLAPDEGTVSVGEVQPYDLSPEERAAFRARTLGFVFQQFHLIPYLSVVDNVLAPTLAVEVADAEARARALLERFGLGGRADHTPAELSTGERQRAALARALLASPPLILADEPTGNLDDDNTQAVLGALGELAGEGHAVLLVTHDEAVAAHAHRTMTLRDGRVC